MRIGVLYLLMLVFASRGWCEYTYPDVRHGDMSVRLIVRVAEPEEEATGPTVQLTIVVDGPTKLEVESARIEDAWSAWKVERSSAWSLENQHVRWAEQLTLHQTLEGSAPLPGIFVRFRAATTAPWEEAKWTNILGEPMDIVAPEIDDSKPTPRSALIWWGIATVAFASILIAVGFWWSRRAKPGSMLSPEAQALADLDHLEQRAASHPPSWYPTKLSHILRHYLASRYDIAAPRKTTHDLLEQMREQPPFDEPLFAMLRDLLEQTDFAKFAPAELSADHRRELGSRMREFIAQTTVSKNDRIPSVAK